MRAGWNSKTVAPIRHTCDTNGKTLFTRAGECKVNISGDPDYKYQAVPRNPISFIVLRQMNAAEDPFYLPCSSSRATEEQERPWTLDRAAIETVPGYA